MKLVAKLKQKIGKNDLIRNFYLKHLKRFDGKVRVYFTLECNLKCSYCVNDCHGPIDKEFHKSDIDGEQWIEALNKIGRDVIITGGEPTLYKDLVKVINGIDSKLKIKMYTNLIWSRKTIDQFKNDLNRDVELYISYHCQSKAPEKFIETVLELKKSKNFNGVVHTVNTPEYADFIEKADKIFGENDIPLIIDDDQAEVYDEASAQKFRKNVRCSKKLIILGPNGDRYQCVSKLVRKDDPLENVFKEPLKAPLVVSECDDYGYCAPCDMLGSVKIKHLDD